MSEEPITDPVLISRAANGYRYYACVPQVYSQLKAGIDQSRGYPHGGGTKAVTQEGLPSAEHLQTANDGSGRLLLAVDTWRITAEDDGMLEPAKEAGYLEEVTKAAYLTLQPLADEASL